MNDIYTFTVPIFEKALGGLSHVLAIAEKHAKDTGLSEEELLGSRIAPDMFPLKKQVQVATDNAKGAVARLAGIEVPTYEDTERTFAELRERINRTIEFIRSIPESAFAGASSREVRLPYFTGKHFIGFDYAREYALPNFFFHVVTAYGLVRKSGAPVGKADYIHGITLKDD